MLNASYQKFDMQMHNAELLQQENNASLVNPHTYSTFVVSYCSNNFQKENANSKCNRNRYHITLAPLQLYYSGEEIKSQARYAG